MKEIYICNECQGLHPCECNFETVIKPPTKCLFDGTTTKWIKKEDPTNMGLNDLFD